MGRYSYCKRRQLSNWKLIIWKEAVFWSRLKISTSIAISCDHIIHTSYIIECLLFINYKKSLDKLHNFDDNQWCGGEYCLVL